MVAEVIRDVGAIPTDPTAPRGTVTLKHRRFAFGGIHSHAGCDAQ